MWLLPPVVIEHHIHLEWISLLGTLGALLAASAALLTALILWKSHQAQVESQRPYFAISDVKEIKKEEHVDVEFTNCGIRAAKDISGRGLLLRYNLSGIQSHHEDTQNLNATAVVVPEKDFHWVLYSESMFGESVKEGQETLQKYYLVYQLEYSDFGGNHKIYRDRFHLRWMGWGHEFINPRQEEKIDIDNYIREQKILPDTN